jgi:hypothetical protein
MKQSLTLAAATLCLTVTLGGVSICAAAASPADPAQQTDVIDALSAAVDATVSATRPPLWPMKRACLYYAIAGQALLAEHGIPARLRLGRVVYWPGTAWRHPIVPHAWLETSTYFIDYAMLPRCGRTAVIPLQRVATSPPAVVAGVTPVLAIAAEIDAPMAQYLNHHRRRFDGRYMPAWGQLFRWPYPRSQQLREQPRQSAYCAPSRLR